MRKPANALAIMAKAPVAGRVKTRLVPPLTPAQAADFYRALLLDQLNHLRRYAGAARYVFYTPAAAGESMRQLGGGGYVYLPQSGDDLGARMQHVFTELWRRGHRNVIVVGSDLPALPWANLESALTQLAQGEARVVLGPSLDGGYYLVGMNRPTPEIFQEMAWSHGQVFAETRARLQARGVRCGLLPALADFDSVGDLRLWRDGADAASTMAMPRTLQCVKKLSDLGCLAAAE